MAKTIIKGALTLPKATTSPSGAEGDMYYNTDTGYVLIHDGDGFKNSIEVSPKDTFFSDVVVLLQNGSYTNYGLGPNGFNGSGTTISTSEYPTGSTGSFYINNDWFSIPHDSSYNSWNGGFTIEFFAKIVSTGSEYLFSRWNNNGGGFYQVALLTPNSSEYSWNWRQEGSTTQSIGSNFFNGNFGSWNHYAIVINTTNGTFSNYLNGTRTQTGSYSGTPLYTSYTDFSFGLKADTGSVWSGAAYIDGIRITRTARYDGATIDVPSLPYPTS